MIYKIKWTQLLSNIFEVEANSEEEAVEYIRENFDVDEIEDNVFECLGVEEERKKE